MGTLNANENALIVVVSMYALGSVLILAVPSLRTGKIFSAVPSWLGLGIVLVEAVTLALYLYASLGYSSSPPFLQSTIAAYGFLLVWLVVAPAASWLDRSCRRGLRLGMAVLVILWIAWSAFFTLAFLHASPKQRPWALPHLIHRIVVDGAWTIAALLAPGIPNGTSIRF